ncbi:4-(cytidine 5'-diphospho)-2-C-methyl-D-erythritol kinase [Inmirania thermothiophila]|uniref:4-diphosphocytidyl-2-C-methyl-D-erythritol kinase n=1 Tax=Inmirania thermothiophila TaxID=1750597 RepID=A0A3N1Y7Q3_9GAMM|nr:4-(cytidine 5'-diphospho)-2-C-methyl-D-erythritol kinase [Inmirania thermothiophila]ROR34805.1 4-diphosphocytidyl-2-C-methyl-D-erythritol kinase [Inmirania thermothiophila]
MRLSALGPGFWPAPAKLNLMLRIVGRRADGYHELQTVFQFLDYGDAVGLRVRRDGAVVRRGGVAGLDPERDLAVRAARALQRAAGVRLGAEIVLHKRIPAGGGLGGGSSDAATVLCALDRLWGCGLGTEALCELALGLGADVPVFVRGRAAWAEGVGERLTPVSPPEPWYLVVWPGAAVATARVFADPALTRDSPPTTIRGFLSGERGNDCEAVVRRLCPEVGRALDWLRARAPAGLSGTGGCVFAAFDEEGAARAAARGLPAPWRAIVARGCNRSPLRERLGDRAGVPR